MISLLKLCRAAARLARDVATIKSTCSFQAVGVAESNGLNSYCSKTIMDSSWQHNNLIQIYVFIRVTERLMGCYYRL